MTSDDDLDLGTYQVDGPLPWVGTDPRVRFPTGEAV